MDTVTHAMAGIAVGAAMARKAPLVASLATAVIASVLPDIDSVLFVIDLRLFEKWHRVFTHSLFALPVIAVAVGWIGVAIGRTRSARATTVGVRVPARLPMLTLVAALAVTAHLALDLVCSYPLKLLYPWSDRDFALYLFNTSLSHPAFILIFAALALALLYPLRGRGAGA